MENFQATSGPYQHRHQQQHQGGPPCQPISRSNENNEYILGDCKNQQQIQNDEVENLKRRLLINSVSNRSGHSSSFQGMSSAELFAANAGTPYDKEGNCFGNNQRRQEHLQSPGTNTSMAFPPQQQSVLSMMHAGTLDDICALNIKNYRTSESSTEIFQTGGAPGLSPIERNSNDARHNWPRYPVASQERPQSIGANQQQTPLPALYNHQRSVIPAPGIPKMTIHMDNSFHVPNGRLESQLSGQPTRQLPGMPTVLQMGGGPSVDIKQQQRQQQQAGPSVQQHRPAKPLLPLQTQVGDYRQTDRRKIAPINMVDNKLEHLVSGKPAAGISSFPNMDKPSWNRYGNPGDWSRIANAVNSFILNYYNEVDQHASNFVKFMSDSACVSWGTERQDLAVNGLRGRSAMEELLRNDPKRLNLRPNCMRTRTNIFSLTVHPLVEAKEDLLILVMVCGVSIPLNHESMSPAAAAFNKRCDVGRKCFSESFILRSSPDQQNREVPFVIESNIQIVHSPVELQATNAQSSFDRNCFDKMQNGVKVSNWNNNGLDNNRLKAPLRPHQVHNKGHDGGQQVKGALGNLNSSLGAVVDKRNRSYNDDHIQNTRAAGVPQKHHPQDRRGVIRGDGIYNGTRSQWSKTPENRNTNNCRNSNSNTTAIGTNGFTQFNDINRTHNGSPGANCPGADKFSGREAGRQILAALNQKGPPYHGQFPRTQQPFIGKGEYQNQRQNNAPPVRNLGTQFERKDYQSSKNGRGRNHPETNREMYRCGDFPENSNRGLDASQYQPNKKKNNDVNMNRNTQQSVKKEIGTINSNRASAVKYGKNAEYENSSNTESKSIEVKGTGSLKPQVRMEKMWVQRAVSSKESDAAPSPVNVIIKGGTTKVKGEVRDDTKVEMIPKDGLRPSTSVVRKTSEITEDTNRYSHEAGTAVSSPVDGSTALKFQNKAQDGQQRRKQDFQSARHRGKMSQEQLQYQPKKPHKDATNEEEHPAIRERPVSSESPQLRNIATKDTLSPSSDGVQTKGRRRQKGVSSIEQSKYKTVYREKVRPANEQQTSEVSKTG